MKIWFATAVLGLMTLSACGTQTASDPTADPTNSPTATAAPAIEHPTGADEVVLRVDVSGGFVTPDYAFATQPVVLVTGDGRVFLPPAMGTREAPRLLSMQVVQADESQIQALLLAASDAGLLDPPPSYDRGAPTVSDAPTTVVTLDAGGHQRQHSAYALGITDETGARRVLADFVEQATAMFADQASQPYVPDQVRLTATPVGGATDNTVQPWTADGVDLARVGRCSVVNDPAAADLLSRVSSTTTFRQHGQVWSVTGAEVLPGDVPCNNR